MNDYPSKVKEKYLFYFDADLSGLPVNIITHYMTEEELVAEFGKNGWKQLPDAISKRYRFIPAKAEVDEHHVGVYASKEDGRIIKSRPPTGICFTEVWYLQHLLQRL